MARTNTVRVVKDNTQHKTQRRERAAAILSDSRMLGAEHGYAVGRAGYLVVTGTADYAGGFWAGLKTGASGKVA